MMIETNLVLSRGGFPPFSARNCTQSLRPIASGELRRTIDGRLLYLTLPHLEKYQSVIMGEDKTPPAFDGLWRGDMLEVHCLQRLCQELKPRKGHMVCRLDRPYVPGSLRFLDGAAQKTTPKTINDRDITWGKNHMGQTVYASFCPILTMRVVDFAVQTQEQQMAVGWRLDLQEV